MRLPVLLLALALTLTGCATAPAVPDTAALDVVLLGEQHDAPAQPRVQERWVAELARRGALAALAVEMAEEGASTAGLASTANEAQVQAALGWNAQAWPWERYRLPVMAAVRAGVPVLGANLPQTRQRAAMADATLDALLPGPAMKAQQQAVRLGHCGLLPERQIRPMTRVQIARDRAMAGTVAAAARNGQTVLLLAGAGHVEAAVGVPLHLPPQLRARSVELPHEATGKDYCEELRRQLPPREG